MRQHHLRKPQGPSHCFDRKFMLGMQVRVGEGHHDHLDALGTEITQLLSHIRGRQRRTDTAIGENSLLHRNHHLIQGRRPLNVQFEQVRPSLVGDDQCVFEPCGHEECNPRPFLGQKGIGPNGGPDAEV